MMPIPHKRFSVLSVSKQHIWPLLSIVIFLAIVATISSYDLSNVDVSPTNATTVDNLVCTWDISGPPYQVNVSWYKDSVLHTGYPKIGVSGTSDTISSSATSRGEEWECVVKAGNSSQTTTYSDTVTIKNALPTAPDISNQVLYEDQLFSDTLTSTDADSDSIDYLCSPSDILDTCTSGGTIEWTPLAADAGENSTIYNITFYATDNREPILVGKNVIFTVMAVNDRPFFSPLPSNQTIYENETLSYSVTVDDEEDPDGPFDFSVSSTYSPERIEYTTTDDKVFFIRFTANRKAEYGDRGNHSINVTACDPDNSSLCVSEVFNLEVIPINQRPVLHAIPDVPGVQNAQYELFINASDRDEADELNFTITSPCSLPNPWSIQTLNSSSNATGLINVTLTNDHIACRNVTISVRDSVLQTDSTNVVLDLSNVNDVPYLSNISRYGVNTQNNSDMRIIKAYTNVSLVYRVNGSDPDSMTYEGEVLTYADNSSLCPSCLQLNMNPSTGIISTTPDDTHVGNFSYQIDLTDDEGLTVSSILRISVYNNTPPVFTPPLANQTAWESVLFTYDINATDNQGDGMVFTDQSPLINISNDGLINFTPVCADLGNHTVNLTVSDVVGASTQGSFNLEIINNPDAPVLPTVYNTTILEEFPYQLDIGSQTTDPDEQCGINETLVYNSTFVSGPELFTIDSSTGIISFTPDADDSGYYVINVSATDTFGLQSSFVYSLTIYNRTDAPVIQNISPSGYPTVYGLIPRPASNMTTVNFSEGMTSVFDHNSYDPDGDPLEYRWTLDGDAVGSKKNLSLTWDYADQGLHTVLLTVSDNVSGVLAHDVTFTWNTTISNVNRLPLFNDSIPNITLNGSGYSYNLQGYPPSRIHFNDPDGDVLTYNHTPVTNAQITYNGNIVDFQPLSVGVQTVIFTASDGYGVVSSNNVTIDVTNIPEQEQEEQTQDEGGNNDDSSSSPMPFSITEEVEVEKEIYFDIIVPEPVTVYRNQTMRQVIRLENTGNITLRGIQLSAQTNITDADISFSTDYFPEILPGQTERTDLIIHSYYLFNREEIILWANVSDPTYKDKAVVYVNAIEKTTGNESVAATKITFARDLLNSNPECMELNEHLKRAQEAMGQKDYEKASNILDSVVQGCKYLVSRSKLQDESPRGIILGLDPSSIPYFTPIVISVIVGLIAAVAITIRAKKINVSSEE